MCRHRPRQLHRPRAGTGAVTATPVTMVALSPVPHVGTARSLVDVLTVPEQSPHHPGLQGEWSGLGVQHPEGVLHSVEGAGNMR